jgi:hypothetical protein
VLRVLDEDAEQRGAAQDVEALEARAGVRRRIGGGFAALLCGPRRGGQEIDSGLSAS